ncbi:SDR family NAD(P)-dependent oxidoreductase [Rhodoferax sp.]|uniref:SDR family NAD(P)-dependent oxidoreductase n=1 Tax=Rhodoferax sp. TaxID=50421 RepID=UPI00272FF740|nr:glucose 1-dehydrogenase [Rhodoferax sp.]MDP2443752.1 glucose 1-dehydrogenase [Rhodoferax sp.]MDZ4207773.1 glucose 1-dehydrogenase [Rhodoferax sp.]
MNETLFQVPLLQGKLALVTGAASGIGQAISVAYAQAGADVIVTDRSVDACAATLARVQRYRPASTAYALDVTDAAAVAALAERISSEVGDIQVLVNNAGVIIREGIDSPEVQANVRRMMEVNYFGTFNAIHAWLPALRRTRGCIINIASGAAFTAQAGVVGYSASKGAVRLLTQSMAADLGPDGIRVNAVAPGVIETPMTEATRNDPERLGRFMVRIPLQRLGQPEEIAGPAVFLASDLASYVNGFTLVADGGKQAV